MNHFIAYHSVNRMGYDYPINEGLCFYTKKEAAARDALGAVVWVVQGVPGKGKTTAYELCGVYLASGVEADDGAYAVLGVAVVEWKSPVLLNTMEWFPAFLKSCANFSLGFSRITDLETVRALVELAGDGFVGQVKAMHTIEGFRAQDYLSAFRSISLTDVEKNILRVHCSAPDGCQTARQLGMAVGFADWRGTNLRYGGLASKLCRSMSVSPKTKLSVLVDFYQAQDEEVILKLRLPVIDALREWMGDELHTMQVQEEWGLAQPLYEGAVQVVQVNSFERNPLARAACIKHYGVLCSVCGFSFGEQYGSMAASYIQVHHLTPLASIGETYKIDPIADLRPLCANCHAVVHLRSPPYTIEEMHEFTKSNSPKSS